MFNLNFVNETLTNGFRDEILDIIALSAIFCSILVIVSKNPIVSVLFLIGLFLSISGYLLMLGVNFIGLSYLLVYVGAVSILFLFILMLINVRISELLSDTSNSIPLAILIGIIFNYIVYQVLPQSVTAFNTFFNSLNNYFLPMSNDLYNTLNLSSNKDLTEIVYVTSKLWDGNLSENSHITTIGNIMYTSYSMWLIICSIILLLAMVGAIIITVKKN